MKLIDEKQENLRKSFEDLQSHSSSSLNFTLKWSDLESYFTTLRSSLQHKFNLLQTLNPSSDMTSVPARPELKRLCEKSDGLGLRRFITEQRPDRLLVRAELPDAYRCAPDAAAMVLDAMEGFFNGSARCGRGTELHSARSSCVTLLEELMNVKPEVRVEVRERAVKVAEQWKQKMANSHVKEDKESEVLGFLLLVGAYGLTDRFSMDELIDCFVIIAKRRQTVCLCRAILPADKITDLIEKLINKDMEVVAVKLSVEFQKTDKFLPVDLLKEYRLKSKRIADEIRKNGKNLHVRNEATMKELNALKAIVKCIDDYHLESEYPKDALVVLIEKLENEIENRKRPATTPAPKSQQVSKPQKPKLNNFSRAAAPAGPTTIRNVIPVQQPHVQAAGLLPDHISQYRSLPAGSYAVPGPTPTVPYAGSTVSPYGLTGATMGFSGNPRPAGAGSNTYHAQSVPPSGYYDRPLSYGGYELPPQYHPSYFPQ